MNLDGKRSGPGHSGETSRRKSLGYEGEIIARVHLEKSGFHILGENYRRKGGEIDIVAVKADMLVFVEVKTRNETNPVDFAVDSYSEAQMERLANLSEEWLSENEEKLPLDFDLRYDLIVVGVDGMGELEVKEHIADAFRAR